MRLPEYNLQTFIPQTRLHPLQIGDDILRRPFLLTRLQQAITNHPFTLISAPAGSGKTTLVAAWLHDHPTLPVTWLRLAEEENELAGFFMALLAAFRQLDPHFGPDWQDLLTTTPNLHDLEQRLVGVLVNEILASSLRPLLNNKASPRNSTIFYAAISFSISSKAKMACWFIVIMICLPIFCAGSSHALCPENRYKNSIVGQRKRPIAPNKPSVTILPPTFGPKQRMLLSR